MDRRDGDRADRLGEHLRRHPAAPAGESPAVGRRAAGTAGRPAAAGRDAPPAARLVVVALARARRAQRRRILRPHLHRRVAAALQRRLVAHVDVGAGDDAVRLVPPAPAATAPGRRRRRTGRRRRGRHDGRRRRTDRSDRGRGLPRRDGGLVSRVRADEPMGHRHPGTADGHLAAAGRRSARAARRPDRRGGSARADAGLGSGIRLLRDRGDRDRVRGLVHRAASAHAGSGRDRRPAQPRHRGRTRRAAGRRGVRSVSGDRLRARPRRDARGPRAPPPATADACGSSPGARAWRHPVRRWHRHPPRWRGRSAARAACRARRPTGRTS